MGQPSTQVPHNTHSLCPIVPACTMRSTSRLIGQFREHFLQSPHLAVSARSRSDGHPNTPLILLPIIMNGAIQQGLASLMDRDPADPEVQSLIDRHFQQINNRYYTCTPEIYRGLGDLYVNDERFKANYEQVRPGLAKFMRAAMRVYCDRILGNRLP